MVDTMFSGRFNVVCPGRCLSKRHPGHRKKGSRSWNGVRPLDSGVDETEFRQP
jgi:hypothetical protein